MLTYRKSGLLDPKHLCSHLKTAAGLNPVLEGLLQVGPIQLLVADADVGARHDDELVVVMRSERMDSLTLEIMLSRSTSKTKKIYSGILQMLN